MSNENHRTAGRRQNALGHSNVICERYCWILDDADVVAVLLKDFVNVSPTRAIHEATVDENYGLNNRFRYCSHNGFLSCAFVCLVELSNLDHLFASKTGDAGSARNRIAAPMPSAMNATKTTSCVSLKGGSLCVGATVFQGRYLLEGLDDQDERIEISLHLLS